MMAIERNHVRALIGKLEALPPERVNEVEDFIDFIKQRDQDQQLTQAARRLAEQSFASVWDNPDDAVYDQLWVWRHHSCTVSFTDQSTTKKRPAVVISSEIYNTERPDLIIMAVTSQIQPARIIGEVIIKDWQEAGLLKPSVVKPVITTIEEIPGY